MPTRFLSALLIGALLFAQGALAAYACPMAIPGAASREAPCGDMEMESAPLCQKHCADEEQKPHDGCASPAPQFSPAFVVRLPAQQASLLLAGLDAPAGQAAPPPLILRNCCLRI